MQSLHFCMHSELDSVPMLKITSSDPLTTEQANKTFCHN